MASSQLFDLVDRGVACVICVSTLLAGLFMLGMRIAERHDPVQQLIKRDRRNKEWTKRN